MHNNMMKYAEIFIVGVVLMIMSTLPIQAQEKETIIIGIQDDTVSLDPAKAYEAVSIGLINQTYERLVTFEEDDYTNPIPGLAESWDVSEDGMTWTFHIRQGITFSTGNPVNADAVVFSFRRTLKLGGDPSWLIAQFGLTEETITKIDEYTVQMVPDDKYAPGIFLSCLATWGASILDPQAVLKQEQDGDLGSAWLEEHSAGSGRFFLKQRIRGKEYILAAAPGYWKPVSPVKQLIVKNISDPFEQAVLLEREEIDIAWNLGVDEVKRLQTNIDIQLFETPTFEFIFLAMNLQFEPLSHPAVRRAIRYAIDYDGIIDFLLQGAGEKIQTFIPKGMLGYNPAMPYSMDVEKAKSLLAEAGYADGFDIELLCQNILPYADVALQIKLDLKAIGINVTIVEQPYDDVYEVLASRQHQMVMDLWGVDYADPDANAKSFVYSESTEDDSEVQTISWMCHYFNQDVSELILQAAQELEMAKREELYRTLTDTILDEGPYVLLYSPYKQFGVRYEIRNLVGIPSMVAPFFPTLK